MIDRYSRNHYNTEQANAVSWLMRYLGQAEEMDYTPEASGSYGENILETILLFGYDSDADLIYKTDWWGDDYYTDDEWAEIMQEELYAGRPLIMCAYANSIQGLSGHAFNIDGYDADKDMYHINWGWSGSGNAHFALNAFRGGNSTYNLVQQLLIGVEPPASKPTIRANTRHLRADAVVDYETVVPFTVKGALLTDDVLLELNDNTGSFVLETDRIRLSDLTGWTSVNVSYVPQSSGTHTATLTLKSDGADDLEIKLTGTAVLETYTPEMTTITSVGSGSFVASWNDATPTKNVDSYRMELAMVPYSDLSIQQRFSKESATWSGSSDCSSHLDDITANPGWTGSKIYLGDEYLRLGNNNSKGWLETPALDMRDSKGWVTVKVNAKCVNTDNAAPLNISCGDNDTTVMLNTEVAEYCVLLPCPASQDVKVRLGNAMTSKRALLYDVTVYTGDAFSPIDQSTASYHEGIDGTTFRMDGLSAATYALCVQAVYTDGTVSAWSDRMRVTLNGVNGDINNDGEVNIADVNGIINVMLTDNPSKRTLASSDINGDGEVNLGDINMVIDLILTARN